MAVERTFAIVKPDAVAARNVGNVIGLIEKNGFEILAMKKIRMTVPQARGFYEVHKERPFYDDLVSFMTEGPVVVLVLEREDAIKTWRGVMGATNPADAEDGTIRKLYGSNIERNAVHGSDAPETAAVETKFFFGEADFL